MTEQLANGRVTLHCGDCLKVMRDLPANSVDSVVTDPPYGLQFMGRDWDKLWRNRTAPDQAYVATHAGELTGRARKLPDYSATKPTQMQEWHEEWARECLRVLKPGGHLLAFGGTRTYHRLACAIEDAGFEVRDQLAWCFGSGFPKSHNVGNGWGTALKPAWEPIVLARKPLIGSVAENVLAHGTGAINVDGCRVQTNDKLGGGAESRVAIEGKHEGWARPWMHDADQVAAHAARVRGNVAKSEVLGRWPANLLHDGSAEVVEAFPETNGSPGAIPAQRNGIGYGSSAQGTRGERIALDDGTGSAARFFYTAKADVGDRLGSKHPTVKPVDLMQYLVRLVTPKGGVVLDCFAGTGTTGEAAFREGMRAVLIEREPEYQADIRRRMSLVLGGQDERRHAAIKASGKMEDPGPLFAEVAEKGLQ